MDDLYKRQLDAVDNVLKWDGNGLGRVGTIMALQAAVETKSGEREATLFDAIKHGDDEHRAWLKEAIDNHFAGKPVPAPRGKGSRSGEREDTRSFNARLETDGILTPEGAYPDRIWFTPKDNSSKAYIRLDVYEAVAMCLAEAGEREEIVALRKALTAIAEGYPVEGSEDRYIIVENPDYAPDNGQNPNLLIDVYELGEHLSTRQALVE